MATVLRAVSSQVNFAAWFRQRSRRSRQAQGLATPFVEEREGECAPRRDVADGSIVRRSATDFAEHGKIGGDHGGPASQGFDHGKAEALGIGRQEHQRGVPVNGSQLLDGKEG